MPKKDKGKGTCKGGSAGVGGAYAGTGRPKIFRPTDEDRKQTGNIAEYFISQQAKKTTPQPLAPAFASGPRSATSSIPVSSTQMPVPITRHSTQVIDVEQAAEATAAECLDRLIADYGSGSDHADASEKSPEVIDVDQVADSSMTEVDQVAERRKKWTARVRLTQQGKEYEDVQLPDSLIEKLETMINNKSRRAQSVRTSWSVEDKQTVVAVFQVHNRKYLGIFNPRRPPLIRV